MMAWHAYSNISLDKYFWGRVLVLDWVFPVEMCLCLGLCECGLTGVRVLVWGRVSHLSHTNSHFVWSPLCCVLPHCCNRSNHLIPSRATTFVHNLCILSKGQYLLGIFQFFMIVNAHNVFHLSDVEWKPGVETKPPKNLSIFYVSTLSMVFGAKQQNCRSVYVRESSGWSGAETYRCVLCGCHLSNGALDEFVATKTAAAAMKFTHKYDK